MFWDTSAVTDNWLKRHWSNGVGIGVRWESPAGPIQLDTAYSIQQERFWPNVSLGIAF